MIENARTVLVVLLILTSLVQEPEPEYFVFLPVVAIQGQESAELHVTQVVVEPGVLVVGIHVSTPGTFQWEATVAWDDPLSLESVTYGSGLWDRKVRSDYTPEGGRNYVAVGQSSQQAGRGAHASVAALAFDVPDVGEAGISASISTDRAMYSDRVVILSMTCLTDYDNDGIREPERVTAALGCQVGDVCYDQWYDMDGDGVITFHDEFLALLWEGVPCYSLVGCGRRSLE